METKEKLAIRASIDKLNTEVAVKERKHFAWIKMRDDANYYRGVWVSDKKDIADTFSKETAGEVKYDKKKEVSIGEIETRR